MIPGSGLFRVALARLRLRLRPRLRPRPRPRLGARPRPSSLASVGAWSGFEVIRFRLKSPMYVRTYVLWFWGLRGRPKSLPRRPETARGRPQTALGRLHRRPGGVTVTPQWQSWDYTAYTSEFKASSHLPPSPSAHLAPRGFGQPPPARFPPRPARQPESGEPMFSRSPFRRPGVLLPRLFGDPLFPS